MRMVGEDREEMEGYVKKEPTGQKNRPVSVGCGNIIIDFKASIHF